MQNFKWTVYALFVSLIAVSSGCQSTVLQQWPLISGLWPGENSDEESRKTDDVQFFPDSIDAESISSLMSKAQRSELENKDSEAETSYRIVLVKNPDHAEAHHRLAILADKQKDFDRSERHYKKSLEKLPDAPELLNDFGYSLFLQKRYDESKRFFQQALNVNPKNRRTLTNLALVQGTMGDNAAAMATLLKIHSPTTAQRILDRLLPTKNLAGTIGSKTENRPTVSIEGIQPLPMTDRSPTSQRAVNRHNASSDPLAFATSPSSIVQIPLSENSIPQPGELSNRDRNAFENPRNNGTHNGNIRQTSFGERFTARESKKNLFYRGPDSAPFGVETNSAESEILRFYYRKAILLGHNVGQEGFLFPVFENSDGRK